MLGIKNTGNATWKKLWNTVKVVPEREFIALDTFIRKQKIERK